MNYKLVSFKRGLTLIEVLISLLIFSFVSVSILQLLRISAASSLRGTVAQHLDAQAQLIGGFLASAPFTGPILDNTYLESAMGWGGLRLVDTKSSPNSSNIGQSLPLVSVVTDELGSWLWPNSGSIGSSSFSVLQGSSDKFSAWWDLAVTRGLVSPYSASMGGFGDKMLGSLTVSQVPYRGYFVQEVVFIKDPNSVESASRQLDLLGDGDGVVSFNDLLLMSSSVRRERLKVTFRVKLSMDSTALSGDLLGGEGLVVEKVYQKLK